MHSKLVGTSHSTRAFTFLLILGLPFMWVGNVNILPTFYNETIALIVWGVFLAFCILQVRPSRAIFIKIIPTISIVALQVCVLVIQYLFGKSVPYFGIVGMALLIMLGASLCLVMGAQIQTIASSNLQAAAILRWSAHATAITVSIQVAFGIVQYLEINTSLPFVSLLTIAGRVYGNLRQPNHFALLLVIGISSLVWVVSTLQQKPWQISFVIYILIAFFTAAVVLSCSRTGFLLLCLMGIWGLFEFKQNRHLGILLIFIPLIYIAFRFLFVFLDQQDVLPYFGAVRGVSFRQVENNDRLSIWNAALQLTQQYPVFGLGYKRFAQMAFINGTAFNLTNNLENAHNIFLQWALDFGLPVAVICTGLLAYSFYKCAPLFKFFDGRVILFVLLCPIFHHLFEYPLDYVYFLFPWAFLFGVALIKADLLRCTNQPNDIAKSRALSINKTHYVNDSLGWLMAPLLMIGISIFGIYDLKKVTPLYQKYMTAPYADRITSSYKTTFFNYFADYAALGILAPSPEYAPAQFTLAEKVSYFRSDAFVTSIYAQSAALSGHACLAKAITYRIWLADKNSFTDLRSTILKSPHENMKSLASYTANPYPIVWPNDTSSKCDFIKSDN